MWRRARNTDYLPWEKRRGGLRRFSPLQLQPRGRGRGGWLAAHCAQPKPNTGQL